jgi:hypothetical protein
MIRNLPVVVPPSAAAAAAAAASDGRPYVTWQDKKYLLSMEITDEEVELLKDENGEIRYEKLFQWCLPRFGDDDDESLFEFQAARMRNYMRWKRVVEEGYKPRYYTGDKVVICSHVARFYGACLCRMHNGGRSMEQIFSKREILEAVPSTQAAMTKGALEDLTTCLHYSNDWDPEDDGVWDDIYNDPKVVAPTSLARRGRQTRFYLQY